MMAQSTVNCEICEMKNCSEWTCVECNIDMCESCKIAHPKIPMCKNHSILEYSCTQRISPLNVFCLVHDTESTIMYCSTCKEPVCKKCIMEYHKSHDFTELSEAIDDLKSSISHKIESFRSDVIPQQKKALQLIQKNLEEYDDGFLDTVDDVKLQAETLKEIIDEIRNQILNSLRETRERDIEYMESVKLCTQQTIEEVQSSLSEFEKSREMSNIDLLKFLKWTAKRLDNFEIGVNTFETRKAELFVPGMYTSQQMEDIFGNTLSPDIVAKKSKTCSSSGELESASPLEISTEVIKEISHNPQTASICPVPDSDTVWVSNWLEKGIVLLGEDGVVKRRLSTSFPVVDIAMLENKDILLVSSFSDPRIYRATEKSEILEFANVSPFSPLGICSSTDGRVLVGVSRVNKAAKVIEFDGTGNMHFELILNRNNKPFFKEPRNLLKNGNGDICVADKKRKLLIAIDTNGLLKFEYNGPVVSTGQKEFEPYDITNDASNNLLVSDHYNHTIHMIDENGRFIRILMCKNDGLNYPWALSTSDSGKLWIGQRQKFIIVMKYMYQENNRQDRDTGSISVS